LKNYLQLGLQQEKIYNKKTQKDTKKTFVKIQKEEKEYPQSRSPSTNSLLPNRNHQTFQQDRAKGAATTQYVPQQTNSCSWQQPDPA